MLDHTLIQLTDMTATCGLKQEWKNTMDRTGEATPDHPEGKRKRLPHMLKIGFANRFGVFGKKLHRCFASLRYLISRIFYAIRDSFYPIFTYFMAL
jgi:hypothetical protein